ncbi:hypothetical protein SAMN04489712_10215 [Thermomonospora echinospora]|uniref:Uncharacterized protein n=1 Tax=Thermomonospora echinospora TaxID=1992 RepID=A0A1H5UTH6_9ACTN|nr:hypothetical protein [Thermomonospora echinospora]SEF78306.1 hypothetical protein SAMN04489712_10215 [Thermomonospora echinospora]
MPDSTNADRIDATAAALSAYRSRAHPDTRPGDDTGLGQAVLLRDLLVDLMHHAEAMATDFGLLVESADRTHRRQTHRDLPDQTDEAAQVAGTGSEVIDLLTNDITDAVRGLTTSIARTGLTDIQSACRLLDGLTQAARDLAHAFPQISSYLQREHAAGKLADIHHDPKQAIDLATLYLKVAEGVTGSLAGSLTRTRQAITGMHPAPDQPHHQPRPSELARQDFPASAPDLTTPPALQQEPASPSNPHTSRRNIPPT